MHIMGGTPLPQNFWELSFYFNEVLMKSFSIDPVQFFLYTSISTIKTNFSVSINSLRHNAHNTIHY